jgi:MFS family permease
MAAQGLLAVGFGLLLLSREYPVLAAAFFLRAAWNLARMLAKAQVGRVVAPGELGMALGITETAIQMAMMFAPMLAGWLYAQTPTWPFYASLGLIAVTLPLVWWFAPKRDAHTKPEPLGDLATIE